MILVLKFSSLIINRIDAEPFFLRHKFFLDFRVGWHTENIQITKVIVPTLFLSCAPCTSTKGRICKYPSVRCYSVAYRPDCQRAGIPDMRQSVMNNSACTPQSPFRLIAQYSGIHSIVKYSLMKEYITFVVTKS